MEDQSDRRLIESALAGQIEGYTELCRRYYPAMVALAHARLRDRHMAEDAAQEAMARAYCNLLSLKDMDKFGPWLASICRNIANDWHRRKSKTVYLETIDDIAAPETPKSDFSVVRHALDALPDKSRDLIYLKYYDGMSYQQISSVLGISEQAINGRLRRAKKQLAKLLKKQASIKVRL